MEIKVKNCKDCPFGDLNYYNHWHFDIPVAYCVLAKQTLSEENWPPSWCPLRGEKVEISIEEWCPLRGEKVETSIEE
jgi:hypothetical protein